MTGEARWVPEAVEDLQSGHDWYDEREPGLGRQFAAEVFAVADEALRHPFLPHRYEHPGLPAEPEVRKVHLRRFDEYGLVYAVVDDAFWIIAVAHAKRRPGYWTGRLERLSGTAD